MRERVERDSDIVIDRDRGRENRIIQVLNTEKERRGKGENGKRVRRCRGKEIGRGRERGKEKKIQSNRQRVREIEKHGESESLG